MSWVALHFASGGAFFSGMALFLAGVFLVERCTGGGLRAAGRIAVFLGAAGIALSATPLPTLAYLGWGVCGLGWTVCAAKTGEEWARSRRWFRGALVACTVMAGLSEFWNQRAPTLAAGDRTELVVLGDSISAGEFVAGERAWPALIAEDHGVRVTNLAHNGATTVSILPRAGEAPRSGSLIVLEIGGNDLLDGTTAGEFEEQLDRLLTALGSIHGDVVMLELPLPPFYNRFGQIQRRLARRHGVALIPKRYFAGVFRGEEMTLDGLHLSPEGHERMAAMVWRIVGPAFELGKEN